MFRNRCSTLALALFLATVVGCRQGETDRRDDAAKAAPEVTNAEPEVAKDPAGAEGASEGVADDGDGAGAKPEMPEKTMRTYSKMGYDVTPLSAEERARRAENFTELQKHVTLEHGTERAFKNEYWNDHRAGTYICRVCQLPLFNTDAKFDSGCGWPSFFVVLDEQHIQRLDDTSYGMRRTEIRCACGSHLGHIFHDAPSTPTGDRYCMNSASLLLVPAGEELPRQPEMPPAGSGR